MELNINTFLVTATITIILIAFVIRIFPSIYLFIIQRDITLLSNDLKKYWILRKQSKIALSLIKGLGVNNSDVSDTVVDRMSKIHNSKMEKLIEIQNDLLDDERKARFLPSWYWTSKHNRKLDLLKNQVRELVKKLDEED